MKRKSIFQVIHRKDRLKILLLMKLTLFFLCVGILQIHATVNSQQSSITLELRDVPMSEAFTTLEEQYRYTFIYSDDLVDVNEKVSLHADNRSIDQVLESLLAKTNHAYKILDNQLVVVFPAELSSQQVVISGSVTDATGSPLPGVTVLEMGTSNGTVTDVDGTYSITVASGEAVLSFSFIGYLTKKVQVADRKTIDVTLEEDIQSLDEVVVVGYGTQQRKDITGSVSSISSEDLEKVASPDFTRALTGQLSGVQVVQSTGAPGGGVVIRVRGTGSITAGNDPLYVVDGIPVNNANSSFAQAGGPDQPVNPLNTLNPNDIASIEVLKDASATAIYGSRGSNGVVIITTKRGQSGEPRVRVNATMGIHTVEKKLDLLNAREVAEFWIEARTNSWVDDGGSADDPFDDRPGRYSVPEEYRNPEQLGEGTDWQDEIFRTALSQNYQISISGGNEKNRYYTSANIYEEEGLIINSGFKKYSFRTNLDSDLSDNVRIGLNFNPSYAKHDRVNAEGHFAASDGGVIATALSIVPSISSERNEDGTYPDMNGFWPAAIGVANPVALTHVKHDLSQIDLVSNAFAEWDIIGDLTLRSSIGVNISDFNSESFHPSFVSQNRNPAPIVPFGEEATTQLITWISETTLNYPFTLGESNSFNLLLGNTVQKSQFDALGVTANNYPNDLVETVNAGIVSDVQSESSESSLLSYFGRVNYAFDDKYLVTALLRADGASNFGAQNRWGIFPSASVGWRISEEPFMQDLDPVSNLKLKGSFGLTGNNAIGNYGAIGLLGITNYVLGENNSIVNGLSPVSFSNPLLGWEKTREFNTGIELGLWKNRVFLSAEYYHKITTDLLLNVNVPTTTGFANALQNIGEVRNSGYEFMLNTHNLTGTLKWATDLNLTFLENEVLALGPSGDPIISRGGMPSSHITMVGHPIGSYYGYVMEGVFVDQADVDANPQNRFGDARPGDSKFKDVNGDGELTTDDRTVIGNAIPDLTYGINNTFSYENFSLTILLQGVYGSEIQDQKGWISNLASNANQLQYTWDNRWQSPEEPGNGEVFRAQRDNSNRSKVLSSNDVHDASYLRIRNIRLDYRFPQNFLGGRLHNASAYLSVQNAYTFTRYHNFGYNPEASLNGGSALTPGTDRGGYPLARVFTVGIDVEF